MPNRDCFTAISCAWRTCSGLVTPKRPPTFPAFILPSTSLLTTSPVATPPPGVSRLSCPIFSSNVIKLRRESIRFETCLSPPKFVGSGCAFIIVKPMQSKISVARLMYSFFLIVLFFLVMGYEV